MKWEKTADICSVRRPLKHFPVFYSLGHVPFNPEAEMWRFLFVLSWCAEAVDGLLDGVKHIFCQQHFFPALWSAKCSCPKLDHGGLRDTGFLVYSPEPPLKGLEASHFVLSHPPKCQSIGWLISQENCAKWPWLQPSQSLFIYKCADYAPL